MAVESLTAAVHRRQGRLTVGAGWDDAGWREIPPQPLLHHMGRKPDHFPRTQVKVAYDDKAVWVMFRVDDRHVRAVAGKHQESVCGDSCVEFFFTPGSDPASGYFNLEMNCGGIMLFHYHPAGDERRCEIPADDCEKIPLAHSLPRRVDPEISGPVTWTVAYALPVSLLRDYGPVLTPSPGAVWRANFYKCADNTSHPHWLTWSPIDHPKPNFHLPHAFGRLVFQ